MKQAVTGDRSRRGGAILACVALAAVVGCQSVSYVAPNKPASAKKVDHDLSFFLFGMVGEEHVRVDQDCGPPGAAHIHSRRTIVDEVLGLVTIGIYTPRTVTVTCAR